MLILSIFLKMTCEKIRKKNIQTTIEMDFYYY